MFEVALVCALAASSRSLPHRSSGYALTFDGRGTDIASARLSADIFRGATGLSVAAWVRAFGLSAAPFRSVVLSFNTPESNIWFRPFFWDEAGAVWTSDMFDTVNPIRGNEMLHIGKFHQWRYIAVTWSSTDGRLHIYVDGDLIYNKAGVRAGYNLTKATANGVVLTLGGYAISDTSLNVDDGFRGSVDQLQLWTETLTDEQIKSDYASFGSESSLPPPVLRYTFDEGADLTAVNSGTAADADLRLSQNKDGLRYFFNAGRTQAFKYTAPTWAPSRVPLNKTVVTSAPIVLTFQQSTPLNLSLGLSPALITMTRLPGDGILSAGNASLRFGNVFPAETTLTFLPGNSTFTSFTYEVAEGNQIANGSVHLLLERPPEVVRQTSACAWPLGVPNCPEFTSTVVITREDVPVTIFLIGRSHRGVDRTSAVVTRTPDSGTLYQLQPCCNPLSGLGDVIRSGEAVRDGSSAVVYVPSSNLAGQRVSNFSFYVYDHTGAASASETIFIDVTPVDDLPVVHSLTGNATHPLTPAFISFDADDAEAGVVTVTLSQHPSHGKVFLPGEDGPGVAVSAFSGTIEPSQILRQHAVDLVDASSHWPSGWRWHPLQALGPQDIFEYGDSDRSWSPYLQTGESFGEYLSNADPEPVSAHNVTRRLSFTYNPSLTHQQAGYTEFIVVKFGRPVFPTDVRVGENRGMCSIVRIMGRNSHGDANFVDLWKSDETAEERTKCWTSFDLAKRYRTFTPNICQHPVSVDILRLEMDTRSVTDWNEIDFVELTGTVALQQGVVPVNVSGLWYIPDPGFVGTDTFQIVACDCPFRAERMGNPREIVISVEGSFPPPSPPPEILLPVVRVGILLPMFLTEAFGYRRAYPSSMLVAAVQAIQEINNKSDGVFDHLLPHTRLEFAIRDSKCNEYSALTGALDLATSVFNGHGVSAIVGADCSKASITAAQVASSTNIPMISPSSTSSKLSDSDRYPYFFRVIPSDSYQVHVMVDALHHYFGYSSCAVVRSTSDYGTEVGEALLSRLQQEGITVSIDLAIDEHSSFFIPQYDALAATGSRIIVIIAESSTASQFMFGASSEGIGGAGYLWLGSDSLAVDGWWNANELAVDDDALLAVLKGAFTICLKFDTTASEHKAYLSRQVKFPSVSGDDLICNTKLDDDGGTLLWSQDHDDDPATPPQCAALNSSAVSLTDPYTYDAVLAVVHAFHDMIEEQRRASIVGSELKEALQNVHFRGLTGKIDYRFSQEHGLYRGDRRVGMAYQLLNYVNNTDRFVAIATWSPCNDTNGSIISCNWSERLLPLPGSKVVYSTPDNSKPRQTVAYVCPYGEILSQEGRCVCADGYYFVDGRCERCDVGQDSRRSLHSSNGTLSCSLCAEGFFRKSPLLPASECQPCDMTGIICALNATTQTLQLARGYWRHSSLTLQTWNCPWNGDWTPCRGGDNAGHAGEGYCQSGYFGPRCKVCSDANMYFDSLEARCIACGEVTSNAILAISGLAILLLVVQRIHLWRQSVEHHSKAFKLIRSCTKIWRYAGMRCKLKALISLYQCIAAVPSVFGVTAPPGLEHYSRWLTFLEFQFDLSIIIPESCFGSYRERLLIGSLWPVVLLSAASVCSLCVELTQNRKRPYSNLRKLLIAAQFRALPLVLLITFIVVPSASTRIFKSFLCHPFEYNEQETRRYLHSDLSVDCSSSEYSSIHSTALWMVVVWPIGIPLMYSVLLFANRRAASEGERTRLSIATAFLYADYNRGAYWWEPVEMCRKLALTGWVMLISEQAQLARIFVALSISIGFLAIRLSVNPYRRPEDSALMLLVELALILIYFSVLVIKICRKSLDVCTSFGMGETSAGPFEFFIIFGLSMLLLQVFLAFVKLWVEASLPKSILLARAHSVSMSTLVSRVMTRRLQSLRRRLANCMSLGKQRLTPRAAAAVYQYRIRHTRAVPLGVPIHLHHVAKGSIAEIHISEVFPCTVCFAHVDFASVTLRWSWQHCISLYQIQGVAIARYERPSKSSSFPSKGHSLWNLPRATIRKADRYRSSQRERSSFSGLWGRDELATVHVTFVDRGGITRVLNLVMANAEAVAWHKGLLAVLDLLAPDPPAAHWCWALSCMAVSSKRGPSGFLRRSELPSLLRYANCAELKIEDINLALDQVDALLNDVSPTWLLDVQSTKTHHHHLLTSQQISLLLRRLSTSSTTIEELFDKYAGGSVMSLSKFEAFVYAEQSCDEAFVDFADGTRKYDKEQAAADKNRVQTLITRAKTNKDEQGLPLHLFASVLLDPSNDAVRPARAFNTDDFMEQPLTHYWMACSHNSYIVGDQLTGFSTADAYRRQLLQGCRQLEIDCWDSIDGPIVTHGNTLCTIERFEEVARAVAECAFVSTELPVILSLEMHCTPKQQRVLARTIAQCLGSTILSYDELTSTDRNASSIFELQHLKKRVLLKGKVKVRKVSPKDDETRHRRLLRYCLPSRASLCGAARGTSEVSAESSRESSSFESDWDGGFLDEKERAKKVIERAYSSRKLVVTDSLYSSLICIRSQPASHFFSRAEPQCPLPITSVNEDRLLVELGLSRSQRSEIEGLSSSNRSALLAERLSNAAIARVASNPPEAVGRIQRRACMWLLRPYPLGLRFSGNNMNPLPCWLAGAHSVALNMSNNDLPLQLHFALFKGSGGYVLKPIAMRDSSSTTQNGDSFWPIYRDRLDCVTMRFLSLHNLPKRGEERPNMAGSCRACHEFVSELSGKVRDPTSTILSSPSLIVSLHPIGGFCAVTNELSLPKSCTETEITSPAVKRNGMNATFDYVVHCIAAEKHATFVRIGVKDNSNEVAYEAAVLGRLRYGYRVFQLRMTTLGTRIELCYLLVHISFGSMPNLWISPLQQEKLHLEQQRRIAHLEDKLRRQTAIFNDDDDVGCAVGVE